MQNSGGIISTGETLDSSTRALCKSYKQSHYVEKQEKLKKETMNFASRSISVNNSKEFFTMPQNLTASS
jgi:hypothetical protein